MKGLVLSGGFGTRLRPLTYSQQKQLIPVANKPILFYALEDIIAAGVHDIGIIVGPNRDQVEKIIHSREWDANISFIYQDSPRGLAHTVLISEQFIDGDSFIMYLGDNLLCDGIVDHANGFRSSGADASILLTEVSHPERFGVAELNERGEVVRLVEKPESSVQPGPCGRISLQAHHIRCGEEHPAFLEKRAGDNRCHSVAGGERLSCPRIGRERLVEGYGYARGYLRRQQPHTG